MKTAIAKKVFMFSTDAPSDEALIEYTNTHSENNAGVGLDSLDLGDTLGYWCNYLESENWSGLDDSDILIVVPEGLVSPEGFTITIGWDWELFRWNTNERPTTLMTLIEDIGVNEFKRRIRDEFGEGE